MHKVVQIDGGIGRCLCATGALERLYERTQEKIVVLSAWPDVFTNAPYVSKCYNLANVQYLYDDIIKHGDYSAPEPYQSQLYYNQKHHLITSFNYLLNGEEDKPNPTIYLTEAETAFAKETIKQAKTAAGASKVIAFQPYGSGAKFYPDTGKLIDESNRSLTLETVDYILKSYEDTVFLNLSHIPINHNKVWNQQLSTRQFFALVAEADEVVTVDSLLSHVGRAFNKKGILFLGGTYPENVGYEEYTTIIKPGYPKSYVPNRFGGFVDLNSGAMENLETRLSN